MTSWDMFCSEYATALGLKPGEHISPAEYIMQCRSMPPVDGFAWGPPLEEKEEEVAHSPLGMGTGKRVCPHDPPCNLEEEERKAEIETAKTQMAKLEVAEKE